MAAITLPPGASIRAWQESDFPAIQRLSSAEGWPTPGERPEETIAAWRGSWPALVVTEGPSVIGFLRALTDGRVTTYVAELLVEAHRRRQGIASALLDVCHRLYPHTRLDLLSTPLAEKLYKAKGFRSFPGYRKNY